VSSEEHIPQVDENTEKALSVCERVLQQLNHALRIETSGRNTGNRLTLDIM